MGALIENPLLNLEGKFLVEHSRDNSTSATSSNAWILLIKGEKFLDIPALLEKAQDQPKAISSRRLAPPSFPLVLPSSVAPKRLRECLWRSGHEPPLPHRLTDLEPRLLTSETIAGQDLVFHISMATSLVMMRDLLWTLASGEDDYSLHELR